FEKVKRFGDVPWYDTQLGSADEALYKPRDSRELVMSNVVADLDFAIEHLPSQHSLYKVTKWTAMALKTRACLFEGTFRKYHNISLEGHTWQWYLEQAAAAGEVFIATSGYSI
ncbi:MAG: RagB/SusD family nutrient uptake outer membrane protein, partial [Bacteroidales bacterium]|nr:RagB/SusD family nutrient uptake outer membrane protein [Bacteroidales bacterium]